MKKYNLKEAEEHIIDLFNKIKKLKYIVVTFITLMVIAIMTLVFLVGRNSVNINNVNSDQLLLLSKQIKHLSLQVDSLNKVNKTQALTKQEYVALVKEKSGVTIPGKVPYEHIKAMYDESDKYNIPKKIMFRLVKKESNFDKNAKYGKARGYMQIEKKTYAAMSKRMGLHKNTHSNNIKVGCYYLAYLENYWKRRGIKSSKKKWGLVLASYNAGLEPVIAAKGMPNPKTSKYVQEILQ